MENTQTSQKKPFYLVTTDIGMGFSVFLFVIGHTALWWDHTLDSQWPNLPLPAWLLLVVAFLVPPGFLFWYTFNSANSLLRRKTDAERKGSRHRLIKRTIIFFFVAEIGELATAIFLGKPIPNYLVTWELFHMFSFSTIFILVIFELAWMMERNFHDYAQSRIIAHASDLTLESIFERILLDYGQAPIIPYLAFSAVGGLLALYLNLPNEDKINIPRKTIPVFILGAISFIVGIILLSVEIYTSPPVQSPISSNLVFISIGFHLITVTGGVILLDLDKLYGIPRINKLVLPLVLISKISLTVYLLHNLAYGIPAESNFIQAIIPSLEMSLFVGLLYALFWVLLAFFWQKSRFKLSIEWIIVNLQRKKWSWWKE
ncbi:MAG: hypothetical protein ACW98F_14620 [Candidatus Hodarchaeales archaeon]|jgi:hypothetical protein